MKVVVENVSSDRGAYVNSDMRYVIHIKSTSEALSILEYAFLHKALHCTYRPDSPRECRTEASWRNSGANGGILDLLGCWCYFHFRRAAGREYQ